MINHYSLIMVVRGHGVRSKKIFKSRDAAINYAFKYFKNNYVYDSQVMDCYELHNKHEIEYVLSDHNRFIIGRC